MDTNWVHGFVGAVAARLAKRAAVDGQRPSRDTVKHSPEIYHISYPPKKYATHFGGIRQCKSMVILRYFPCNSTGFLYIQGG